LQAAADTELRRLEVKLTFPVIFLTERSLTAIENLTAVPAGVVGSICKKILSYRNYSFIKGYSFSVWRYLNIFVYVRNSIAPDCIFTGVLIVYHLGVYEINLSYSSQ